MTVLQVSSCSQAEQLWSNSQQTWRLIRSWCTAGTLAKVLLHQGNVKSCNSAGKERARIKDTENKKQ